MRAGATQSSPTASPKMVVTVDGDVYTEEVVTAQTDEQLLGGSYIIELDNSDSALSNKDYKGKAITINYSFSDEDGSDLSPLWVYAQRLDSREGKLILRLECVDAWGLLSMANAGTGAEYWNYPEQAPDGSIPTPSNYDKTIFYIINSTTTDSIGKTTVLDDDDGIINTNKPVIYIANARSGVAQLQERTECYLLWGSDGDFHVIKPDAHATCYSFNVANLFYVNLVAEAITLPNRVTYWGRDSDMGWISGSAVDDESHTRLGDYMTRHIFHTEPGVEGVTTTVGELETLAASALLRIQGERNEGWIVAPMHCALELLDKVEIVDDRYSTPRTTVGYIHRILREYDRGVYRITIYLGGTSTGYTPDEGAPPMPIAEKDPGQPFLPSFSIQGFWHDLVFTAVDWDTISWDDGTAYLGNGVTGGIDSGSLDMATDNTYYLYWEIGEAALQVTTTYSDIFVEGRLLVATARRASDDSNDAFIFALQDSKIYANRDSLCDYIVGELQIANDAIENRHLLPGCVNYESIGADQILADHIYSINLTTLQAVIGELSALSANVGTLTSGTISGVTIEAGGGAVVLDGDGATIIGENVLRFKYAGDICGYMYATNLQAIGIWADIPGAGIELGWDCNIGINKLILKEYAITPMADNNTDLGDQTHCWNDIWLKNRAVFVRPATGEIHGTIAPTISGLEIWSEQPGKALVLNWWDDVGAARSVYLHHDRVIPFPNDVIDLGSDTYYWKDVYADTYYGKTTTIQSFQEHDDIALLRKIKPKKNKGLDIKTFPAEIVKADAIDILGWQSLVMGAVLQLASKVEELEAKRNGG